MKFEVPKTFAPLTDEEKRIIHESVEVYDGFVYFHRVPNPSEASVMYSTDYIIQLLTERGYTSLLLDFTNRTLVNHQLRRLMLTRASEMVKQLTFVGIILDGSSFRRVIIDFFVRAYIRRHECDVQFFESKNAAMATVREQIESNQP